MKFNWCARLLVLACLTATQARAADFSDPTWPCIQRKVENLSLGIMWPHPVPEEELGKTAQELAGKLALRRISLEDGEGLITEYAAGSEDVSLEGLGAIFADVFHRLNNDRGNVIKGIEKYSLKQLALSEKIDQTRIEMDTLMKAAEPDFDRVDLLEEQIDWDERIYRDRAQSLTFVCETPVLLEKRIYAIAQSFLKHAPE